MKYRLLCAVLPVSVLVGLICGCAPAATRGAHEDRSLVTAEDLERYPEEPIESIIQRNVPGVMLARMDDGETVLQIRGASSAMGDIKPPLYVLDGIPLAPRPGGVLASLNRFDIASIKVLKGADAAIYGIDGAHGVIVITTKKARPPTD